MTEADFVASNDAVPLRSEAVSETSRLEVALPAPAVRSGCRLSHFLPAWMGAPQSVHTKVSRGFHWTWLSTPSALHLPRYTQTRPDLLLPIQDWVSKGVIYPVPSQPCFQSRVFTVPWPDGRSPRIIIDLSTFNGYAHAAPHAALYA